MSIFNPQQKATFSNLVSQSGQKGDSAILSWLNTQPQVDNPSPQPLVPITLAESSIAALLSNASLVSLLNWVNLGLVEAEIQKNNAVGLALWAQKLAVLGLISPTEAGKVIAYTNSTEPDPNWQAKVPGLSPFQAAFPGITFSLPDGSSTNQAVQPMLNESRQ